MVAAEQALRELVEFVARSLVDDPAAVQVAVTSGTQGLTVALRVSPADMGKVIGRGGRTARALRAVVRAAAVHQGVRATLQITSEGVTP